MIYRLENWNFMPVLFYTLVFASLILCFVFWFLDYNFLANGIKKCIRNWHQNVINTQYTIFKPLGPTFLISLLRKYLKLTKRGNFIKKEALIQVFSCEFCEISQNTFSYRTPPVAASDFCIIGIQYHGVRYKLCATPLFCPWIFIFGFVMTSLRV